MAGPSDRPRPRPRPAVRMKGRVVLFFSLCVVSVVEGLYFHIGETERKCFIEEIPDETMVTGEERKDKLMTAFNFPYFPYVS